MSDAVRYPSFFKILTGTHPEKDKVGANGQCILRKWQRAALRKLRKRRQRIIVAPTGSGKSLLIEALTLQDLLDGRARKAIVAVPQSIIASSFDSGTRIRLPGQRVVSWVPEHKLIETTEIITKLRAFLTRPLGVKKLDPERLLVCSHAALIAYHHEYHGPEVANRDDWSDYKGVALNIDEAHHARCPDEETKEETRDAEARNRLGSLVSDWLTHKPGPITMATATWFRSDHIAIIPPDRYASFGRYTLSIADYLATRTHLKEIEIRFLNGTPERCVEQCYQEDPDANTLIYIRPVAPGRDKLKDRNRLLKRLGMTKTDIIDLVDPAGRGPRKDVLIKSVKNGEWDLKGKNGNGNGKKPWLFALMLGREGFDLPALQRSIVIGPRYSMQVTVQMLGRLLRDHPGKKKVQFNIVLPFLGGDMQDGALIQSYTKVMLATLALGCVMWPPRLETAADRKTYENLTKDGPNKLGDTLAAIADAISDDPEKDPAGLVDGLIQKGRINLVQGSTPKSLRQVLLAIVKRQASAARAEMLESMPDVKMAFDVFTGIRSWRLAFGHGTLTRLSQAVGKYPAFTWEAGQTAIRAYTETP